MKKFTVAVATTIFFTLGGAMPTTAVEPAASFKKYSSCNAVWNKFPWGVARDLLGAKTAMNAGLARPDINRKVYEANKRKLDKDRNGVVCERATQKQAEDYIGNLFEEFLCDKGRVEGSPLGPECAKYGYSVS